MVVAHIVSRRTRKLLRFDTLCRAEPEQGSERQKQAEQFGCFHHEFSFGENVRLRLTQQSATCKPSLPTSQ